MRPSRGKGLTRFVFPVVMTAVLMAAMAPFPRRSRSLESEPIPPATPYAPRISAVSTVSVPLLEPHATLFFSFPGVESRLLELDDASPNGLRVEITKIAAELAWHLQVALCQFAVAKGDAYSLSFEARADSPRVITCALSQAHDPWDNLGFAETLPVDPTWRPFRFAFAANRDDPQARINLELGQKPIGVEFRSVRLEKTAGR